MAKRIQVGGRIESKEVGGIVTGAAEILDDAKGKKQSVINQETDDELVRLGQSKQDNLNFDNAPTEGSDNPVKSGGVYLADKALSDAIEAILLLIPSAASALNKLVDTAMMNSSISTATATFRGTYNVVTDLSLTVDATHEQIAAALGNVISTADNNDYAFVQVPVSAESIDIRRTERYKFNGTAWGYEYNLNTSGFTAAQWAAINSGITLALVGKLIGLPTSSELQALLGQKQDTLTFDNVPTAGSANPVKSGGVHTAINDEKTAREQLAQTVTDINGRVGNVEEVIPTGAAADNKLVANNSMEAYVTSIIEAITASFTIATADGHINLTLTQTNGRVASLTLTSSDIASAQALTALTGRVTTAEGNITTLGGRVSTNETDIANLQQLYNGLQQSKPEPVTALPETGQQQGVIYRLAGTTSYSDYMWNGSTWVLMATYNNAIDPRPKKASQNLVTSGGVFDNMGALDVSELNATENPHTLAQYVDLSAALAAIPTDYQKGGMSIKFVQSSDNNYLQFRYMGTSTAVADFTNVANWQGVDDNVTPLSKNVVESNAVAEEVMFISSIGSIQSQNYFRIVNGNYVRNGGTYSKYKGVSFPKMNAGDKLIFQITGNDSVNNAFDIGEFTFSSGQYNPTDNQQALTSITGTVSGKITYTMQNDANVVICLSRDLTVSIIKAGKKVKEAIEDIEDEIDDITGDISTIQGDVTNIKNTLNSADDTVEYGSEDLVKSGAVAKELVLSSLPINSMKAENYKRIIDGYYVSNPSTYARYQGVSFAKMSAGDKLVFNLTGEDTTNTNYDIGEFIFNSDQYSPTVNQQALAYMSGVINGSSVSYTMQNDANVVICLSRQFTVTLQKQTGTIKEKVIELGSRMDIAESEISSLMPTQPYIAEAEEATKDAQAYPADLKLAIFSDPHTWNRITYQVLDEINKLGTIDFVAGLGDFQPYDTTAVKAESMLSLAKMMSVSGRNLGLYVVGNHDIVPNSSYVNNGTYSAQTALSKNEVFDCFDRHLNKVAVFDEDNPYGGYYYVDFSASKVRIIVLNTSDIWNSAGTITKHYKQAMTIQQKQVDWLMGKALDFSNVQNKEDWGVLVLNHNIINTENLSAVIYPILIAFKNGESINTSVTLNTAYGSEEKDVITIVHDFSEQGSMDVIASLEGHTHVYREYPIDTPTIGTRQLRTVTFNADNKIFNQLYQKEFDSLPAGEYYIVASGVTLVFTLSDSYNDVILKYRGYGISTTRQAGCSINDVDSGVVLYEFTATKGTPSAEATELTGFVTDQPDGTAETETCYIVGVDRSNRILHIIPYGHGTEKTVNY